MTLDVLYVQPGFGAPGGVTVDVANLVNGLRVRRHHVRTAGSLQQVVRSLRTQRPSLVHFFGCLPSATTLAAIALPSASRIPTVWTPIFNPIRRHTWSGYGLLRAMEVFDAVAPRTARFVDAVIAATAPEGRYFAGLGARRVEVIPPGVDAPVGRADAARLDEFRSTLGVGSQPLVLIVGRDNSRKALPFGLASFRQLRQYVPSARLLLVGPDRSFSGAVEPGVHCPGWLDARSMSLAYQAADVLFVPSLYEGLPRAVIEAWRWATPVVATDRVGLAPVIDGVGGHVVPYGDVRAAAGALAAMLDDADLTRHLGRRGQEVVLSHYLMPDLVQRTLALYLETVERNGR
jgi:glycosyltransferase involved in cell wall biosynthesis